MIPKFHGEKLTDIPDEDLAELLVSLTFLSASKFKMLFAGGVT